MNLSKIASVTAGKTKTISKVKSFVKYKTLEPRKLVALLPSGLLTNQIKFYKTL